MDKMKPSVLTKSSSSKTRRDVETAIMETETRTELSVEYSVPSITMDVQTDELEAICDRLSETNRSLDRAQVAKILQKLYLARRILNPVIDEIITTASTISETELTTAQNSPICSLSKQDYKGALRASQIFKEVNEELIQKYNKLPLVAGKNFRFPTSRTIVNMVATSSNKNQNKSILEVADRIYIDKSLMLQLIDLYEILGETIKRLKEKESAQKNMAAFQPVATSSEKTFHSAASEVSNDELMCTAKDAGVQNSCTSAVCSKKTSANASAIKPSAPPPPSASETKPSAPPLFESVEEAKARAMKCLQTLADVQQYFERNQKDEIDLTNKFALVDQPERDTCGKKAEPHIHALLNGIPVILTLGAISKKANHPDVIMVSSSTDLLIKSNKSHKKIARDSNTKCSSAQSNENLRTTPVMPQESLVQPAKPISVCPCNPLRTKPCICTQRKRNTSKSQQYLPADVNSDVSCQVAESQSSLVSFKSASSGSCIPSALSIPSTLKKKAIRKKSQEKETAKETTVSSSRKKVKPEIGVDSKSSSETTVGRRGKNGIAAAVSGSESCICESASGLPYTVSKNSMPKGKKSTHKSIKSFQFKDLHMVSKPAKCCRKSCLNELPLPAQPYPVSLTSLRLDDNDIDIINKNIRICTKKQTNNNCIKPTCYTCLEDKSFLFGPRVFQVMYFQIKLNKAIQNELTPDVHSNGRVSYKIKEDFSQLFKPKKSRGNGAYLETSRFNTLFNFEGPTFEIIRRNASNRSFEGSGSLTPKTRGNEKAKTVEMEINSALRKPNVLVVKDAACNYDKLADKICVDSSMQYDKHETTETVFEAIWEDVDEIPPVLYDKEGNMYLIEVTASNVPQKKSVSDETKTAQNPEALRVHFSTGCQCNESDLIASYSLTSDYLEQKRSDLSFIRDRVLRDVKRILSSKEIIPKPVYNSFAFYNSSSKPVKHGCATIFEETDNAT